MGLKLSLVAIKKRGFPIWAMDHWPIYLKKNPERMLEDLYMHLVACIRRRN